MMSRNAMGLVTGIIVYLLTWWVVLFMTLPLWVKPTEPGDTGYGFGAPKRPYMGRKLALTSAIAAVLWVGIYVLVVEPWITFRGS
jgi:predicted secreted protein